MWGDEYIPPDPDPRIDTGSPWITALWIIAAIAVVLAFLPGGAS